MKFEYLIKSSEDLFNCYPEPDLIRMDELSAVLSKLGEDCWELINIVTYPVSGDYPTWFFFKRAV